MYSLKFIEECNFEKHILETLSAYNESLKFLNLEKFNSNVIDPIKLLFDKSVYRKSFDDIIELEIHRQRDKSNTNAIGYFHQNMFKYINYCEVPKQGWDIIFDNGDSNIYVEMKNKHNTMNSSSSQKTYIQMQNQILKNPNDYCYLVEVLAPSSRDLPWTCSINSKQCENEHIRRISIDKFYKKVTGIHDSFYQICMQLPKTIDKLVKSTIVQTLENDTVIDELRMKHPDTLTSLYLLAFQNYEGFDICK